MPLGIRLEQPDCLAHEVPAPGDDAETAAVFDIQVCQIEGQQIQFAAVDDHQLAVVSHQIVGRARHRDSGRKEPHLQVSEVLFAGPVRVRRSARAPKRRG